MIRMTISVLICTALCDCWKIIDWKEVWWEGERYGMVRWCGGGSYIPMFKMASNILLRRLSLTHNQLVTDNQLNDKQTNFPINSPPTVTQYSANKD